MPSRLPEEPLLSPKDPGGKVDAILLPRESKGEKSLKNE